MRGQAHREGGREPMRTIAWCYGIMIQMYYDDHNPPHFHARYGPAKAIVRRSDGETIAGELPPAATRGWCNNGRWRETPNCRIIGSVRVRTCRWKR